VLRDFLDELCVVEKNNQSRTVLSGTLFRAYQQECQRNGQREIWSPAYFGKQLSERGFGSRKIDGQRCRTGISLKSEFVLKFDKSCGQRVMVLPPYRQAAQTKRFS
jgi:phage/plasmid-associated DNA primase